MSRRLFFGLIFLLQAFLTNCGGAVSSPALSNNSSSAVPSVTGQARILTEGKGYFPIALKLQDSRIAVIMRAGAAHVGITGRLEMIFSADEGKTWTDPVVVVDSPIDDRNPALGQADDGTIVVAYWQHANYDENGNYDPSLNRSVRTLVTRSSDGGKTWSPSSEIDVSEIGFGSPYGRMVTSPNGTMYMNIYGLQVHAAGETINPNLNYSYVYRSVDRGQTWQRWSISGLQGYNEAALVMLPDGTLRSFVRAQNSTGIYISSSVDGRAWSPPVSITPSEILPADAVVLPSGEILVTVGNRQGPYGLNALVSKNGTFDWRNNIPLINDSRTPDCGYPSTIVLNDGNILTFYYATSSKALPGITGVYMGVVEYKVP